MQIIKVSSHVENEGCLSLCSFLCVLITLGNSYLIYKNSNIIKTFLSLSGKIVPHYSCSDLAFVAIINHVIMRNVPSTGSPFITTIPNVPSVPSIKYFM